MKYYASLFTLLFFIVKLSSQSYEGSIGKMPVWLDMTIAKNDSGVTGVYFYKKIGTAIQLKGNKNGNKMVLTESDKKGTATGFFTCLVAGDSVYGRWGKKTSDSLYRVVLLRTDSTYRKYAKNQKFSELITADGSSLQSRIDGYSDEGYSEPATVWYLYNRNAIVSIGVSYEYMGAYPAFGTNYYLFNLADRKELSVWNEIDPHSKKDLYKILVPRVITFLKEFRNSEPDSVWIDLLGYFGSARSNRDAGKVLDTIFSVVDTVAAVDEKFNGCYLDSASIHFTDNGNGYFGFPHAVEAMDSKLDITMSFSEFIRYLKPSSVLKNLDKRY